MSYLERGLLFLDGMSKHLGYEEIVGLIDDELETTDKERIECHLDLCTACLTQYTQLKQFKASMAALSPQVHYPQKMGSKRNWVSRVVIALAVLSLIYCYYNYF